jgi:hypothetical protein
MVRLSRGRHHTADGTMTWQDSQPTLIERCAVLFSRRHGGGQRQSFSPVQIHAADRQAIVGQRGRATPAWRRGVRQARCRQDWRVGCRATPDIGRAVREGVDRSRPLIGSTAPIFGAAIADHDWRLACRLGPAFLAKASHALGRSPCGLGPGMGYPPAGNLFVRDPIVSRHSDGISVRRHPSTVTATLKNQGLDGDCQPENDPGYAAAALASLAACC